MIPHFVPYWTDEERINVMKVLDSDYLNEYKTVRQFEKEFAEYVGARYCVTVTSGTIALYLAVLCSKTDQCIIPDHDGIFALNASIAARRLNVIYDVDKHGCLDYDEETNEPIMVHANGRISEKVVNIEDCSQATFHHTKGKISTYSLASTKHITSGGQGGAICCDDEEIFDLLSRFKDHGRNDRQNLKPMSDNFEKWGLNFKFLEIQAAFALAQLRSLPNRMRRFDEICSIYYDMFSNYDGIKFDTEKRPKWYVDIHVDDPQKLKELLHSDGIGTRRFPKPLHMQPIAESTAWRGSQFDNSISRYSTGLYLPSTTNLTDEEVKRIADAVRRRVKEL